MAVLLNNVLFLEHPRTGSTSVREALKKLGGKPYPRHQDPGLGVMRVTTLRNPLDLLVSWWLIVGERDGFDTFEDFITHSQHPNMVRDGRLFYFEADCYMRFEELEHDFRAMLITLGIKPPVLGHLTKTEGKRPYLSYHTEATIAAAKKRFAEDFECGYL